jgi:hypothetical protein
MAIPPPRKLLMLYAFPVRRAAMNDRTHKAT